MATMLLLLNPVEAVAGVAPVIGLVARAVVRHGIHLALRWLRPCLHCIRPLLLLQHVRVLMLLLLVLLLG